MTRDAERIAVAVCTRRRPRMLSDLMSSLQGLDVPQGSELVFLFVENDTDLTIADQVSEFARYSGWKARAIHAPDPGIVQARNAAMAAAREEGADWLAFVDDDEQVRPDWLRSLRAGAREAGAHVAGGPVRPVAPKLGCSDNQAEVLRYYQSAAETSDRRKESAARAGRRFDLATNNWLGDLAALEAAGLAFDPTFNVSGGEDTDLSRRAHKAGLVLTWVPGAIVTEEVDSARLSAAYIYERARDQTITKFDLRVQSKPFWRAALGAAAHSVSKSLSGAVRVLLSPIMGRYQYYRGLRSFGVAAGYLSALAGRKQQHYSEVTGE